MIDFGEGSSTAAVALHDSIEIHNNWRHNIVKVWESKNF